MSEILRVLIVEDSEADAGLLLRELARGGYDVTYERVQTAEAMKAALGRSTWDLVLSDYSMPEFSGPAAFDVLKATGQDLPFIIISGTIGEETAVNALKAGAHDFLVKGRLARLAPAIERELGDVAARREHRRVEEQLRQAQKMEAIGQLAGGIAHDFNNMLTAILGYAELLTEQIGPDKPVGRDLREIVLAAERAASLTRQLLAFSRKQRISPVPIALATVVTALEPMLRRLIGEHITIRTVIAPDVHPVLADATQLEQVLMNLAVNARDAMPDGGTLTIEVANAMREAESGRMDPAGGTEYVMVAVGDTGIGMTPEVRTHIFEPFFTTKEPGHGTGLGLAAVYGIVKQLAGDICVDTELGRGSVFKIYLPRTNALPGSADQAKRTLSPLGTETILVVEDEAGVRTFVRRVLERHGYRVVEAASGEDAVTGIDTLTGSSTVDMLVTDLMLSGMKGTELTEKLRQSRPTLPVLFMSGYSDRSVGVLPLNAELLEKPFTAHQLLTRVRDVLNEHGCVGIPRNS